jgi:exopolysaccharide production protein ExoQ
MLTQRTLPRPLPQTPLLRKLERWTAVLMLLFLSNGILWIVTGDSESSFIRSQGTLTLHLLQALLYGVVFSFVLLHWRKFVIGLVAGRWVLLLSLGAVASVLWSVDPSATAMHALALLATTAFGIYFGSCFSPREQIGLLVRTFILIILLSAAFALLLPKYGVDHYLHWGNWQGIFPQKNLLGKAMVVSVIVFLSARGRMPGVLRWLAIAASILLLGLSRSKAALLLIPIFFVLAWVYRLLRLKKTFSIPVAIGMGMIAASAAAFAVLDSAEILALLHRDPTLTGRTTLWAAVWSEISKHMALGYGFDAFWNGLQGQSANIILTIGWAAKHSHNGFLDILLDLGVLGLCLFLVGYFVALRQAIRLVSESGLSEASWPLHYLAFIPLYYMTEGQLLQQDNIHWALYVAVVVCVATVPVRVTKPAVEYVTAKSTNKSIAGPPPFAPARPLGTTNA